MESLDPSEQYPLQCMEVRGGHGSASNFFKRPGLDVSIWSQTQQAAELEGGDVHYITSCASGRITRMLMADVGGINNLFADVAGRMRDLMKHSINAIAQTSVVSQISAEMYRTSQHGGFASTLLSTFFAPTRTLTICNAGHPPPLLYRSASDDWSSLRYDLAEPLPAADFSGTVMPSEYQSFKLKLDVGDMFFFYSNSLTECRQRDGRTLGVEGILNLAHQFTKAANSENSLSNLILEIRDSHPDNGCGEDATMILGKVTDSRVTLRDNFLAPFRLLRGAADRTSF